MRCEGTTATTAADPADRMCAAAAAEVRTATSDMCATTASDMSATAASDMSATAASSARRATACLSRRRGIGRHGQSAGRQKQNRQFSR
jgi:hypothetical protein